MSTANSYTAEQFAKYFSGANIPAAILSGMILLLPALGVPSVLMVQDTLKSAIVAFAVLTCTVIFFYQQRERTRPLLWHRILWLPIALMLYALSSIFWSHSYLASVETIRWFLFSLLLWLSLNSFTHKNIALLVWAIHGGAVVACIWTTLQFWFDFALFPQFATPSSTFINRNFFAEYIVCTLPFSLWALVSMRESRWLSPVALSFALNIVALMMTGCRSAIIAAMVMLPILVLILIKYRHQFAYFSWKKSQQILVLLIFFGGIWGMASIGGGQQVKGATALQIGFQRTASFATAEAYGPESSYLVRLKMWHATLGMIKDRPLTGIGAGSWEIQIPRYQPNKEMSEMDYYTHNEYLQLLSEYGLLIGSIFLILLAAYLLTTFYKTWQLHGKNLSEAPLRALALTSLLALLIVSGAGFPWHLASTISLFAICLGLLAGSDARSASQADARPQQLLLSEQLFLAKPLTWNPGIAKIALALTICALLLAGYITRQAMTVEYKILKSVQLGEIEKKLRNAGQKPSSEQRALIIANMREATAITPHYRKLSEVVVGQLIGSNDWENALWLSESLAASRPYVPMLWFRIAHLENKLGKSEKALAAVRTALQLQAVMPGMRALEIDLLSKLGREAEAIHLANTYFDSGAYDYLLTKSAHALAVKAHDWPLAIRALTLRNQIWPAEAPEGHLQLGNIYMDLANDSQAVEAFRAAINAAPEEQKQNIRDQVPEIYRDRL